MILKSIKLDNIRSYVSGDIQFPQGSLVLSGDIGSGKSTILLAAEFALFGLRSDLRGESLLRHGKSQGAVELCFSIDGKDVIIKRGLKRTSKSVQQDTGHLIVSGAKKDLTAVELKTRILDILGYPKELVSKSKSLVYRYTVYTPQEQMKEILFDEKEERLNTLRRVFGIDRYRRVIENTSIITRQLKMSSKELAGSIHDLEEKKSLAAERKSELRKAEDSIREIKPALEKAKQETEKLKESVQKCEKEIKELNELKSRLSVSEATLREKLSYHEKNAKEISALDAQIKELLSYKAQEMKEPEKGRLQQLKDRKNAAEKEAGSLRLKINELEINTRNSSSVIDRISKLSTCPTCRQDVPDSHKAGLVSREKENIAKCTQEIEKAGKSLSEKESLVSEFSKQIDISAEEEKKYAAAKAQAESSSRLLKDRQERMKSLAESQSRIKQDIASINTEKLELAKKISALAESEQRYRKERKAFDELREKERQLELKRVSFEKEAEGIAKIIASFERDIAEKEKAREKIVKLKQTQEWLENSFVNLITVIEKHVMAKVHEEFNDYFQQWFRVMIEDEALSVSLDRDFTPSVEQDGYETSLEHLSGGEKTAIALAYRLSLNKVINDMIGSIKTKDIIILDEPTDGFSSEQLDKVREVIEQLDMKQVIIVSHEQKIEGFVDSILRVEKRGHVSSMMQEVGA